MSKVKPKPVKQWALVDKKGGFYWWDTSVMLFSSKNNAAKWTLDFGLDLKPVRVEVRRYE